ncbi:MULTISPECIES: LLM class F420-dependent oxidoreductase [Mycobacteriaceae]|jgi:probable F420-dependent oxidoreductase|uniref:LLM class F420-dependent oxidoreductase n=11 Tax=Mycobacteriaceae TaxID=1762 RepID=A0A4R5P8K4_9MYCO|nr:MULTISPECIES: LLM class F420-dependent oxidoreductase [Mycobacteriaceae]EUA21304.1 F420-dependent oxidoreductase family protein [Mycobacterium kansasii 662]KZS58524.1 LLM class F420-dependent oxidoreductase [Mycobacterium ostraviense]MDA3639934.1 LLM class F420-dependent oxidoreductase [Mycobacterium xenopi]ORA58365.1 LLM class F420-dependent oxidoreductase [Mycobacteroides franklinii]TXH27689.1 MAG: LLM class F420-dependent oxidoreductase [Mycobacterium sp.]
MSSRRNLPIRVGVQLWPGDTPDYRTWRDAVITAEQLGVDAIFGYDHFHKPATAPTSDGLPELLPVQPDVNNFEGWTSLASWGEITSRAEIGLLVTGVGYRNPDLLADMARTVDHISDGRLILGIGSGWYEKDYVVYGYEYGTVKSRMDLFERSLKRISERLDKLIPAPTRSIPILIGGMGVRRTLPLVARYADIWHTFASPAEYRRKNALLGELAQVVGRDESAIERAVHWTGRADADAFASMGVTFFTTEIHPDADGFDFRELKDMIHWRDTYS